MLLIADTVAEKLIAEVFPWVFHGCEAAARGHQTISTRSEDVRGHQPQPSSAVEWHRCPANHREGFPSGSVWLLTV